MSAGDIATIIICIVVAAAAAAAVIFMIRSRKKGKPLCGSSCENCPENGICHMRTEKKEKP